MKNLFVSTLCLILCFSAKADGNGLDFVGKDGQQGQVTALAPNILRVTKFPDAKRPEKKSLSVILKSDGYSPKVSANSITAGKLTATVDKNGNVTFSAERKTLLKEKSTSFEMRTEGADKGAYNISQVWTLAKDEAIYGAGILQDGLMNRRNSSHYMVQNNTEDFVNSFHSAK